jgi:hypothetical protein
VKKRANGPECNQEITIVGLRWHRLAKHNIQPNKSNIVLGNSSFPQLNAQLNAHSETIPIVQKSAEKPQEAKTTMEQETKEHNPQASSSTR